MVLKMLGIRLVYGDSTSTYGLAQTCILST